MKMRFHLERAFIIFSLVVICAFVDWFNWQTTASPALLLVGDALVPLALVICLIKRAPGPAMFLGCISGLAALCFLALTIVFTVHHDHDLHPISFVILFAACGAFSFCSFHLGVVWSKPNQSTDPTLASGTPPAEPESRHP
jgi:hypothetical protein